MVKNDLPEITRQSREENNSTGSEAKQPNSSC